MTEKNYKLLDDINRSGIDNTQWGLCQDVNAYEFFGATQNEQLQGQWLYVYMDEDGYNPIAGHTGWSAPVPDYSLRIRTERGGGDIALYRL